MIHGGLCFYFRALLRSTDFSLCCIRISNKRRHDRNAEPTHLSQASVNFLAFPISFHAVSNSIDHFQ